MSFETMKRISMMALSILAVGGIGLIVLRYGMYVADDRNTLFPVAQHSLEAMLKIYIRPIEYYAIQAANKTFLPLWIAISIVASVFASSIHVKTAEIITKSNLNPELRLLVIVGSPLWFAAVSQVDTVSQCLCNLLFSLGLFYLARLFFSCNSSEANRISSVINIIAALLLYTKELAVAASIVLPVVAGLHQIRMRRWSYGYIASSAVLTVSVVSWIALKIMYKSMLPESGGHYNLTPSLLDLASNTIITFAFALTPLPSSFLSIAPLVPLWIVCGLIAALYFAWSMRKLAWRSSNVRWFAVAVLGSLFPMFYVHASELYASMAGSFFLALLIMLTPGKPRLTSIYCVLLLLCSYLNCFVYFNAEILQLAHLDRKPYSIYLFLGSDNICSIWETAYVAWSGGTISCK